MTYCITILVRIVRTHSSQPMMFAKPSSRTSGLGSQ